MENQKKVSLELFEQTARDNGYEVFTPEEVASYYKEGLMKSQANKLSEEAKKEFVADMMYLQKAVCSDAEGKQVIRYFRKEQVDWEKTEDGVILKGIEGVYKDTPENRRLNRVGKAYTPSEDFMKSLTDEKVYGDIIKSINSGCYADTPENKALGRVGKPYANRIAE